MLRFRLTLMVGFLLGVANVGCMSRAIREGAGAVRGASGRVVALRQPASLAHYKGLRVESITVAPGLDAPGNVSSLVSQAFLEASQELTLSSAGSPALLVQGEIIHYETGGTVSVAIGPLQEIIVRTQLSDAETHEVLGSANLVGRAKSLTASGEKNLAEGAGKALKKWLKKSGLDDSSED